MSGKHSAFAEFPAELFPLTFEWSDADTGEVLQRSVVEEAGGLTVPGWGSDRRVRALLTDRDGRVIADVTTDGRSRG